MIKSIYVLNYECGNVKSVSKAFAHKGYKVIQDSSMKIPNESLLVIPGVGHFGYAMKFIKNNNLDNPIKEHYYNGGRILGICLGMQILFESSEEAPGIKGLGLLKGNVKKLLNTNKTLNKKMHLGWSKTKFENGDIHDMYYVHQYFCDPNEISIVSETFNWGNLDLCAGIKSKKIRGFQFHPEKSSKAGLDLLNKF